MFWEPVKQRLTNSESMFTCEYHIKGIFRWVAASGDDKQLVSGSESPSPSIEFSLTGQSISGVLSDMKFNRGIVNILPYWDVFNQPHTSMLAFCQHLYWHTWPHYSLI